MQMHGGYIGAWNCCHGYVPEADLLSYESGYKQGTHDYNCNYYESGCSNIINNICDIGELNVTNATACVGGYVDAWKHYCVANLTAGFVYQEKRETGLLIL